MSFYISSDSSTVVFAIKHLYVIECNVWSAYFVEHLNLASR